MVIELTQLMATTVRPISQNFSRLLLGRFKSPIKTTTRCVSSLTLTPGLYSSSQLFPDHPIQHHQCPPPIQVGFIGLSTQGWASRNLASVLLNRITLDGCPALIPNHLLASVRQDLSLAVNYEVNSQSPLQTNTKSLKILVNWRSHWYGILA